MPKTSIITVNYRAADSVIESVESLLHGTDQDFEMIIVENQSPDNSRELLTNWLKGEYLPEIESKDPRVMACSQPFHTGKLNFEIREQGEVVEKQSAAGPLIRYVISPGNNGFAAGCNLGHADADASDYIWFLNPDTAVTHTALAELVATADSLQKKGVKLGFLGCKMLNYYTPDTIHSIYKKQLANGGNTHTPDNGPDDGTRYAEVDTDVDFLTGSSMFIPVPVMAQIGDIDETWFLNWEEIDWQMKAKKMGYVVRTNQDIVVYHKVSITINSFNSGYYNTRNIQYFLQKHFPERLPSYAWKLLFSKFFLARLLRGRRDEIRGILLGLRDFRRGVRGKFGGK
jgi:GT2 family glycosyltransferase